LKDVEHDFKSDVTLDKLHRWITKRDVAWAKQVGVGGLLSLELMPIHLLIEEFI
jgi:hypothetical protein